VQKHRQILAENPEFTKKVLAALVLLDAEQTARQSAVQPDADAQLYDGFYDQHDSNLLGVVRAAEPAELTPDLAESLHDPRLKVLLSRYKARNHPSSLTPEERAAWEVHRHHMLLDGGIQSRLARFMHRLGELSETTTQPEKRFLLEELQLYAESIMPVLDDGGM